VTGGGNTRANVRLYRWPDRDYGKLEIYTTTYYVCPTHERRGGGGGGDGSSRDE